MKPGGKGLVEIREPGTWAYEIITNELLQRGKVKLGEEMLTRYELDRMVHTSANFFFSMLRSISHIEYSGGVIEFITPEVKGFYISGDFSHTVYVYNLDESLTREIVFRSDTIIQLPVEQFLASIKLHLRDLEKAELFYREGTQLMERGDYTEAQYKLTNACWHDPESLPYKFALAWAIVKVIDEIDDLDFYGAAIWLLKGILEEDPWFPGAREMLEQVDVAE